MRMESLVLLTLSEVAVKPIVAPLDAPLAGVCAIAREAAIVIANNASVLAAG
jgi:hypothetical protein